jgi:GTPase SAR1 family protein
MGTCSSNEAMSPQEVERRKQEKEKNRQVEMGISQDLQQDKQINKLLLLGAGESGKSTLFKQMISIYGKGFSEQERSSYVPIIYNNIITSMKTLCKQSHTYGAVSEQNRASRDLIDNDLKGDEDIDPVLGQHIANLWHDEGIQVTYANRAKYQLTDSAAYFFDKIKEVSTESYLPSQQDVLRSRVRTTGIVENEFEIDNNKFKMFDVGGQRNERKKWIHCFENVTAVLFVAAISEYDQVLYEDENTNRITEALNLFEEICNSRWFHETSMILFLNKRDLFSEKISRVPLRLCFPDYEGKDTYEEGSQYVKWQFESRNKNKEKVIYTHITCATDTDNVAAVFNAVKDIIIRQSLGQAGLL